MYLRYFACIIAAAAGILTPERMISSKKEVISVIIDKLALSLAIIGGLNWGLIGIFRFDLVAFLFGGQTSTVSRVIYTLVGLAAIWCISLLFRETERADDSI